jgi:hypothetical protein
MTDQNGENPVDPTEGSATPPPTPPPAAPAPPPASGSEAPASGGQQYDFNQARETLQGAPRFDLGIIAAGVIAWLAGFMPFYSASASVAGHSISAHASSYHGFFGWFAVWVALAGAGVVAAALFGVKLPVAVHQAAVVAFAVAVVCLILALFVVPGGDACNGASVLGVSCSTGHGFGYWLALLASLVGLGLSAMQMRSSTATTA